MSNKIERDAIAQRWVHSHEEDSDAEMVYRPASYKFPPSRGRTSFELKPDGGLIESGIGPTDRHEESQGKWQLDPNNNLVFHQGSRDQPVRILRLASVDQNRLVVKK